METDLQQAKALHSQLEQKVKDTVAQRDVDIKRAHEAVKVRPCAALLVVVVNRISSLATLQDHSQENGFSAAPFWLLILPVGIMRMTGGLVGWASP